MAQAQVSCGRHAATWPNVPIVGGMRPLAQVCDALTNFPKRHPLAPDSPTHRHPARLDAGPTRIRPCLSAYRRRPRPPCPPTRRAASGFVGEVTHASAAVFCWPDCLGHLGTHARPGTDLLGRGRTTLRPISRSALCDRPGRIEPESQGRQPLAHSTHRVLRHWTHADQQPSPVGIVPSRHPGIRPF